MTRFQYSRAVVVSIVFLGASLTAAQEPVIYTDNRATSSTFRDRGTSYRANVLIYVDKQRTPDQGKHLIADWHGSASPRIQGTCLRRRSARWHRVQDGGSHGFPGPVEDAPCGELWIIGVGDEAIREQLHGNYTSLSRAS